VALDLPPGSAVVLYTDGVTEARDRTGTQLGEGGLLAVLRRHGMDTAEDLAEAVTSAVVEWRQGSPYEADDLAVLALTVPSRS
jgi:serine phosphatase RsbU (regulator of sigma subunit)